MDEIKLYTDGACSPNPGAGGWSAILIHPKKTLELSGGQPDTTNNRMELTAVVEGLRALKRPCKVTVYSDSQLIVNCIIGQWRRNANHDLWQEYDRVAAPHDVDAVWVRGHNGDRYNERADTLAVEAIRRA